MRRGAKTRRPGTGLVAIGLGLLMLAGVQVLGTGAIAKQRQRTLRSAFDAALGLDPSGGLGPAGSGSPIVATGSADASEAGPHPPGSREGPHAVARLRIPAIGLDVIVVEGITGERLAWGPGRYPQSAPLGGRGATAIAGHRTGWGGPFFNLDRLERGDRILIDTPRRTYTYRVTGSTVVKPDAVWVLGGDPASTAERRLTLTTCTPAFSRRDRLIVWADLIGVSARR